MSLAFRRKLFLLLAAAALAFVLVGATINAPVLADCNSPTIPVCGG